jgi:hypothetical protein
LFVFTLPLINPWVRGDGVGYYAYVRSLLVEHKLDFSNDWRSSNESFAMGRVGPGGIIYSNQYTSTSHLDNHFAVGPAMLWAPFLAPMHGIMLALRRVGFNVEANGYSRPYVVTMALATAAYGFLGLLLSFLLASHFTEERWALLATLGIWFASSVPVYMYFNPSWSHAHSMFVVALLLWYWQRTRRERTLFQWMTLGLISGLVLDVYYANIAVLLVPLVESLIAYWRLLRPSAPESKAHVDRRSLGRLFGANLLYCLATLVAFSPTLITRQIIYGHPFDFGYGDVQPALWQSPHALSVLFSSDHGLLVWTPILLPAIVGVFLFWQLDRVFAAGLVVALLALFALISIDASWDGISSFGNRFFISLTPLFVLGLAVTLSRFAQWVGEARRAMAMASSLVGLLVLWNLAFMFQWGTHLVPARGPISWKQMVYNQFFVVPRRAASDVAAYFHHRGALMQKIEQEDVHQLKQAESGSASR